MKKLLLNLPVRIIVYATDVIFFATGFLCAVFIYMRILHINPFPVFVILNVTAFHVFFGAVIWKLAKMSQRIIRYSAVDDFVRLASVSGLVYITSFSTTFLLPRIFQLPFEIWLIALLVTFFLLISSRLVVGFLVGKLKKVLTQSKHKRLLIYGTGELGLSLLKTIKETSNNQFTVIGFIDDDKRNIHRLVMDLPVYSPDDDIHRTIITNGITHIILAKQELQGEKKARFLESIIMYNLKIRELPSLDFWLENNQNLLKLQQIDIADLLVRKQIELKNELTVHFIKGKTVMVTGAAGSIGSEIVRKLRLHEAGKIICLDFSESALFELEMEMKKRMAGVEFVYELTNIRDSDLVERLIVHYRPQIIFHAAAYKHVPILESSPAEAIRTNVLATWKLAELAGKYGVLKFIMISTDKAVNPTSVMGATKRMAEMVIQGIAQKNTRTAYINTRFGNVLGSNGSVVPLFKKQIAEGGPVTVTHPDVIRYFMTISEACQLVLEAAVMGDGGEIYVFDMGEPVKIYDLARNMIRLSGYIPERDIQIVFTGLRPGEKLFENLFSDKEKMGKTHHEKILIGKVRECDLSTIMYMIEKLEEILQETDTQKFKQLIKEFVPEYRLSQTTATQVLGNEMNKSTKKNTQLSIP